MKIHYCIEVDRELKDDFLVIHEAFDNEQNYESIEKYLINLDIDFQPKYHSFTFYKVY